MEWEGLEGGGTTGDVGGGGDYQGWRGRGRGTTRGVGGGGGSTRGVGNSARITSFTQA